MLSGTPTSVLRLPGVPSARAPAARSTATTESFVEVLPYEPVTPTTRAPRPCSTPRPIRPRACTGSWWARMAAPESRSSSPISAQASSDTSTAAAPAAMASGACSPPSTFSPGTPTNS